MSLRAGRARSNVHVIIRLRRTIGGLRRRWRRSGRNGCSGVMDEGVCILAGLMLGVIGFLWTIHRDMRGLSDRVARLEGLPEGSMRRREPAAEAGG